jgi:hypothetical protein
MKNKEDRIIEEIRDSLMNYELPYEEGAWERFNKREQAKETTVIFLEGSKGTSFVNIRGIMAVAASLILLISIVSIYRAYNSENKLEVATIDSANLVEGKESSSFPLIIQKERLEEESKVLNMLNSKRVVRLELHASNVNDEALKVVTAEENKGNLFLDSESVLEEKTHSNESANIQQYNKEKEIKIGIPFGNPANPMLLSENNGSQGRNWKFGLELSSSFISEKMNYGGGVFMERKISEKFSLTSGLAYTKINAANETNPVGISASTRKVGVESSMQALDIPLSIIYEVKDGFYASVGVSLLAVLNEDKAFQYETDIVSESFVKDPNTGLESAVYSTVTRQYTEPVDEMESTGKDNIGYFNLSVGKKQSFYGNTQLLLEPFLKLPLVKQSDNEVKLMNAGLKIKVMF